jgi:hypothetical protein
MNYGKCQQVCHEGGSVRQEAGKDTHGKDKRTYSPDLAIVPVDHGMYPVMHYISLVLSRSKMTPAYAIICLHILFVVFLPRELRPSSISNIPESQIPTMRIRPPCPDKDGLYFFMLIQILLKRLLHWQG